MKHLIFILTLAGMIAVVPASTFAHTSLSSSNIAAGSQLASAPDELELEFAKPVGLAAVTLEGPDGSITDLETQRAMRNRHSVGLPQLSAGNYRLSWRAVAGDGHVITGEIAFTVIPG